MKDAKGHGSNTRGGSNVGRRYTSMSSFTPWPKGTRFVKGTLATADEVNRIASGVKINPSDTEAARSLASGPKSAPAPIHDAWSETPGGDRSPSDKVHSTYTIKPVAGGHVLVKGSRDLKIDGREG